MRKSKILIFTLLFAFVGLLFGGFKVNANVQTSNQISVPGAQVRTAGSAGIRFVGKISADLDTTDITAFGMAVAFGETEISNIVVGGTANGLNVLAAQVSSVTEDYCYYINLIDIPDTMYGQKVTTRAYYVLNGETIYSDTATVRSLGQVTLAVKAAGDTSELIEEVFTVISTKYKNVYTDSNNNVFVTSSIYETNPINLESQFIKDWNTKFGTTMETYEYATWQTSAIDGTTPLTANTDADCSGTNAYEFFITDTTTSTKWKWLLNFLLDNKGGAVHPTRQINALLGGGTASDTYGSGMNKFAHLSRSLQNFFDAKGTDVFGSGIDIILKDFSKYAEISNYNTTILCQPVDLIALDNDIDLPTISVSDGYTFHGYSISDTLHNDSYVVSSSNVVLVPNITANEYNITFMNGEEEVVHLATTYTIEDKVKLPELEIVGYDFKGWYENKDLSGSPVTEISKGNIGDKVYYAKLEVALYSKVNVSYDLNGGYFLYNTVEDAIADFLVDYNTFNSKSHTASTFYTIASMSQVHEAAKLLYSDTYKEKWSWLVEYIATVASDPNVAAYTNFYNFDNYEEFNAANPNYVYMLSYELRGWVGQAQYTRNQAYVTADYSDSTIQASSLVAAKGKTSYVYKDPCDLLTPTKTGDVFIGWKSSADGTIITEYPGYADNHEDIIYTAVYQSEYSTVDVSVNYDLNGGYFRYETIAEAIEDFLKDYNALRGTSHTADTFYAIGSWNEISGASVFLYNSTYKAKWTWLVNYIATVAGSNNKAAFANFYNYSSQSELDSANSNYIYCIAYELRGWVGQAQYTQNANYPTADYSSSSVKSLGLIAAKGQTEYTYNETCDLLIPSRTGYTFVGWKSSVDGEIVTEYPGYYYNPGTVVYTAQWEEIHSITLNGVPYATLAAALSAAQDGDVIFIPSGTNSETVTISKSVTIRGNNAGINPNTNTRNAETVLTGVITISNVNGLTIDGVALTGTGRIKTNTSYQSQNVTLSNIYAYGISASSTWIEGSSTSNQDGVINFFSASNSSLFTGIIVENSLFNVSETAFKCCRVKNVVFKNNQFLNNQRDSIRFEGGYNAGYTKILNNVFSNTTLSGYTGVYFRSYGASASVDITIDGNEFKNIGASSYGTSSNYVGAICARNYQEHGASWTVTNNKFENCYNYLMIRNNASASVHTSYSWAFTAYNNTFIGEPTGYYYNCIGHSGDSSTNPYVAIFYNNEYYDSENNTITPDSSKFIGLAEEETSTGELIGAFDTNSWVVKDETIDLLVTYVNSNNSELVWASEDTSIATVSSNGTVTGVSEGVATITVSDASNSEVSFTFYVTVFNEDPTGVLKMLVDSNNASVYTRNQLLIGITYGSDGAYYADLVGSVSKLLFEDYKVYTTYYLSSPSNKSTLTGANNGVDFITFHYAADMPYSATYSLTGGSNLASYNKTCNSNGTSASWHFSTGNDGIWACQNTAYGAWHAGSSQTMKWVPSGLTTSDIGTDIYPTDVTLESDNYFYIKGKRTTVTNTTGYSYTKFNNMGLGVKLVGSEWYVSGHYYKSSYGYICSVGGNQNSIGIESSVRNGSDLWLTWQYSAQLCAQLLNDYNLPLNRLVGHHFFTGKWCPQPMLENDLELWYEFVEMVRQQMLYFGTYSDYDLSFSSDSSYLGSNGRIISQPSYSKCVTYTVDYTINGVTKSVTLSSIVPGTVK